MVQPHNALASGIVRRLRVVFFSIGVVLVSSMIIGVQQLLQLEASSRQLTDTSIPEFERAEELERNLKNLLLLLQRVDIQTSPDAFEILRSAVEKKLGLLRSNMRSFEKDHESLNMPPEMRTALRQMEQSTTDFLDAKDAALKHAAALDTLEERLSSAHIIARHQIKQLAFLPTAPRSIPNRPEATRPEIDQKFTHSTTNESDMASMHIELSLKLEGVMDQLTNLRRAPTLTTLYWARKNLTARIDDVSAMLEQLPDTPQSKALGLSVLQVRNLTLSDTGFLALTHALMESTSMLERQKASRFSQIREISDLSQNLFQSARTDVTIAGEELRATHDSLVFVIVFSATVALLVILFAWILIVEHQINQRMAKLTRAVLAIAEGHNETEVTVSGPDELGEIARALEVFKCNALELQRSNVELEKFAYVAAHDLRSPLRAIRDLADWTLEDPDTMLSEDGQQNMTLLLQRIARLNQLLTDLLEYSRVGKEASDVAPVSLGEVVRETAELLDPNDLFRIRYVGHEAPLLTFATPLRHILLNLLSNAIKHHDRSEGRITVEGQLSPGQLTCLIRDDGPGIEPQYHDRIFSLFQTLRPRDEVEGSGLGLAIIRKLLEHHDGSIHVRSDPARARGAEFIFTLPEHSQAMLPHRQAA